MYVRPSTATIALAFFVAACTGSRPELAADAANPAMLSGTRTTAIVAINDVYRIAGVDEGSEGGLARIRTLRKAWEQTYPNLLFLHAGDFLYPSLMSKELDGVQMIDILNWMDGDGDAFDDHMFVTFGNHEFENNDLDDAAELNYHIDSSRFLWINSNIVFEDGADGQPVIRSSNLSSSAIVTSGGIRFGIFSMTGSFETAGYIRDYRLGPAVAGELSRDLRSRGAEVVVALTHLKNEDDVAILEGTGRDGPDLIVGGHEHSAVRYRDPESGRWMTKADADARTASVIIVTVDAQGNVEVSPMLSQVNYKTLHPDPLVSARVMHWEYVHDVAFCGDENLGCLDEVIGRTQTDLIAEEVKIRSEETTLGNLAADQMLEAYPDADIALINSGSLRLNQDLAAGTLIRRRHIEELFAWPAPIRKIRITGATLMDALTHSVVNRGEGAWLQVAGLRFSYTCADRTCRIVSADRRLRRGDVTGDSAVDVAGDVAADAVRDVAVDIAVDAVDAAGAWTPIGRDDLITAVVGDFMVCHPGRDGYLMWDATDLVDTDAADPCASAVTAEKPDLKVLVMEAFRSAEPVGVAPGVERRIVGK